MLCASKAARNQESEIALPLKRYKDRPTPCIDEKSNKLRQSNNVPKADISPKQNSGKNPPRMTIQSPRELSSTADIPLCSRKGCKATNMHCSEQCSLIADGLACRGTTAWNATITAPPPTPRNAFADDYTWKETAHTLARFYFPFSGNDDTAQYAIDQLAKEANAKGKVIRLKRSLIRNMPDGQTPLREKQHPFYR